MSHDSKQRMKRERMVASGEMIEAKEGQTMRLSRGAAAVITDSRYDGAMPDSFFKQLNATEEEEFRQWAHDNYSLTLPAGFAMFHPVIRDEWRKIENE